MRLKYLFLFLLLLLMISGQEISAREYIGHTEGDAVSVYDQEGNYIFSTAMGVMPGDRYISSDNIEYLVEKVEGQKAVCRKIGEIKLLEDEKLEAAALPPLAQDGKKLLAIYHTHNGESYLPGPDSVRNQGEIFEIGKALKEALEEKGVRVIQSDNLHLPQDGAAYERSRATAVDLIRNRPDAIFDIHRDAIPRKEEYLEEVDGQQISQVRIVVGRQNPNRELNEKFAKQFKAVADELYPGLIRDIFFGSGAYNQELSTRLLLLEFGTHVTSKEQAIASTRLLADTIIQLLYGNQVDLEESENRGAFSNISWILIVFFLGVFAYLFINEGSWQGVVQKIKGFISREVLDRGDGE